jgi:hypothetical protein
MLSSDYWGKYLNEQMNFSPYFAVNNQSAVLVLAHINLEKRSYEESGMTGIYKTLYHNFISYYFWFHGTQLNMWQPNKKQKKTKQ